MDAARDKPRHGIARFQAITEAGGVFARAEGHERYDPRGVIEAQIWLGARAADTGPRWLQVPIGHEILCHLAWLSGHCGRHLYFVAVASTGPYGVEASPLGRFMRSI